jgi:DNA-binding Xre family transcriptional regulator
LDIEQGLLCPLRSIGAVRTSGFSFPSSAKQVRLTVAKANLLHVLAGEQPITMNSLAVQAGVSATTITRLARPIDDPMSASALSLDLAGKIVSVLDCGIEDLLEVVEQA